MTTFMILAAAIPGLLVPAAAIPPATVPTLDISSTVSSSAPKHGDTRRYCIDERVTGSRLPQRQCQTRDGWARDGVNIDELLK